MAYRSNKWFPEIFKLYSPEHTSHRLHIPDAFVTYCDRLMPQKAILNNKIGKVWHVDVDYVDNGVFFQDGWSLFVRDNSLECGDLLSFQYNGDCEFRVKIFGESGCEKIGSGSNGAPYMNAVKLEKDEEDTTKEEEEATIKKGRGMKQNGGNNRRAKKRVVYETEEEEEEEESAAYRRDWKKSRGGSKKLSNENLCFTAKARGGPIHYNLYVPTKISKALKLSGHIFFRNEHGEQWHGTVSKVKGRDHENYITGWKSFCMSNHVGPDDLCDCEFLRGSNEMGNIIQVHIIRAEAKSP